MAIPEHNHVQKSVTSKPGPLHLLTSVLKSVASISLTNPEEVIDIETLDGIVKPLPSNAMVSSNDNKMAMSRS